MTKYIVKLSEQEEMALRQLAMQPGFEVIFKLLQTESLDAQSNAMDCQGNKEERLMALTDAQATVKVVSSLIRKLAAFREAIEEVVETPNFDPLDFNVFDKRSN